MLFNSKLRNNERAGWHGAYPYTVEPVRMESVESRIIAAIAAGICLIREICGIFIPKWSLETNLNNLNNFIHNLNNYNNYGPNYAYYGD